MDRLRLFLWIFGLYLGVSGTVTFTLFIHEEAIQTATWGTWPAADVKDWKTVRAGIVVIKSINRSMTIINYVVGWIQPLAFISYRQYSKATYYYIKGLETKVFANAPELFFGEQVEFNFRPQTIEQNKNGTYSARYGKIVVITLHRPVIGMFMTVKGLLEQDDKQRLMIINQHQNMMEE